MTTARRPARVFGSDDRLSGHRGRLGDSHLQCSELEVDVTTSQSPHLASPQLAPRRQQHGDAQVGRHCISQRSDLGDCRDRSLRCLFGGCTSNLTGIAPDQLVSHCGPHDRGEQTIGLRSGGRMLSGGLGVPRAHIGRCDVIEPPAPECRLDMSVEQPAVQLDGALGEVDARTHPFVGIRRNRRLRAVPWP
jgi:hypothetical protein